MEGYDSYKDTAISTDNRFDLIQLMYEEIIKNLLYIKKHMIDEEDVDYKVKNKAIQERTNRLNKTMDIIEELKNSLSDDGEGQDEMAHYLHGLYSYQSLNLAEFGLNKDMKKLEETTHVFKEIKQAWVEMREQIEGE